MATRKPKAKAVKAAPAKAGGTRLSAREMLRDKIARSLGVTADQAELRALREMADRLGVSEAEAQPLPTPRVAPAPSSGSLGQRMFVELDGRGLDGRGMPIEVIELPCYLGSGRKNQIWINSPRVETRHLAILHGDEGWVVQDLGSEHGTFFHGERIERRTVAHGDELQLAGYLRVRFELK